MANAKDFDKVAPANLKTLDATKKLELASLHATNDAIYEAIIRSSYRRDIRSGKIDITPLDIDNLITHVLEQIELEEKENLEP